MKSDQVSADRHEPGDHVTHTEVVPVDPNSPDADVVARAAVLLRNGKLVAFPTETVYGLGADALNPAAVARIFAAKGRPSSDVWRRPGRSRRQGWQGAFGQGR